jgi:hypothetical protein
VPEVKRLGEISDGKCRMMHDHSTSSFVLRRVHPSDHVDPAKVKTETTMSSFQAQIEEYLEAKIVRTSFLVLVSLIKIKFCRISLVNSWLNRYRGSCLSQPR